MKPKYQRAVVILFSIVFIALAAYIILGQFKKNLVFFYSPSELVAKKELIGKDIRIGGLVLEGSVRRLPNLITEFTLTDLTGDVVVRHRGSLPGLFRQGQGMVSSGQLDENGIFISKNLLAKHDENYMPPEVMDALKKSGKWKAEN